MTLQTFETPDLIGELVDDVECRMCKSNFDCKTCAEIADRELLDKMFQDERVI